MLDDLKYSGPERLDDGLKAVMGDRGNLDILDLGCGSGLGGLKMKPRAASLIGVDLAPEMIALASARNIYDRLDVGEITQWLQQSRENFDLIFSSDCLIYFGDLSQIIGLAANHLRPGGFFALSMECGKHYPYRLTDTGRYNHHPDHVREAAAKAGLDVRYINEAFLRFEYGEEVAGLFAVLGKS